MRIPYVNSFSAVYGTLAYLDAGTGSLALQALIGALLTGIYVIKTQWSHLAAVVRRTIHRHDAP